MVCQVVYQEQCSLLLKGISLVKRHDMAQCRIFLKDQIPNSFVTIDGGASHAQQ